MTNEVEKLILTKYGKQEKTKYEQLIAYKFYKEIWKYILYTKKYDIKNLEIKFNVYTFDDKSYYIRQSDGINYKIIGAGFEYNNLSYYQGCDQYYIDSVMNTNIDIELLLKLFESDNFEYNIEEHEKGFWINLNINIKAINKAINNVLIKNKTLKNN